MLVIKERELCYLKDLRNFPSNKIYISQISKKWLKIERNFEYTVNEKAKLSFYLPSVPLRASTLIKIQSKSTTYHKKKKTQGKMK